jgi:hypothetical protein
MVLLAWLMPANTLNSGAVRGHDEAETVDSSDAYEGWFTHPVSAAESVYRRTDRPGRGRPIAAPVPLPEIPEPETWTYFAIMAMALGCYRVDQLRRAAGKEEHSDEWRDGWM